MRRTALAAVAVLLVSGCGLPLASGVHRPGAVAAEQRLPEPISVLPPGPQPGATPEAVVLGFLAAQSSARDAHGIARGFLAAADRDGWHDDAGVTVYDPRTATTARGEASGGELAVVLTLDVLGDIAADGAAHVQPAARREQRYRLRQDAQGEWRLVGVPQGLTLSPAGRDRSFEPLRVHFLVPGPPGPRHLVADLVQVAAEGDRAAEAVARLLAGPSSSLAGSVDTALPAGVRLRRPVRTGAGGEVTVDLAGPVGALAPQARADLSAQLVWTLRDALPDFTRLRLLVEGEVLAVPGVAEPQPRGAWASYDPDSGGSRPSGVAVVGGQLRSLAPDGEDRGAEAPADVQNVLDLAVDARRPRLAVLTGDGPTRTLRTGRYSGPVTPVLADPGLRSPTWGSGELGLWLLRTGPRPAVLLVPEAAGAAPVEVAVDALPALGDDAVLRVSRDGTRVALVAGGVLQVGRLELGGRRPHVVALRRLATRVLDVAWRSGTELQVLLQDDEPPLLPLETLSVDGTSVQVGALVGAAGEPVSITAYRDRPLLVETRSDRRSTVYGGDVATGFEVRVRDAARPSYPR